MRSKRESKQVSIVDAFGSIFASALQWAISHLSSDEGHQSTSETKAQVIPPLYILPEGTAPGRGIFVRPLLRHLQAPSTHCTHYTLFAWVLIKTQAFLHFYHRSCFVEAARCSSVCLERTSCRSFIISSLDEEKERVRGVRRNKEKEKERDGEGGEREKVTSCGSGRPRNFPCASITDPMTNALPHWPSCIRCTLNGDKHHRRWRSKVTFQAVCLSHSHLLVLVIRRHWSHFV